MDFVTKIISWVKLNLASAIGMVQVVLKFVKEVLTLALNILFPAFPHSESFEATVTKVRDFVNTIDAWFETLKSYLLILQPSK